MRSLLFVPGDSPRKLDKGFASGADILLIDLEDSVAPAAKAEARRVAAEFLASRIPEPVRPRLYVRVNALDTGLTDADLDAVIAAGAEGIMLPKACGGPDVTRLDAKIAVREAETGRPDGAARIIAIATETAEAVFRTGTYRGASHRLEGLAWGGEDLAADIGAANRDEAGAWLETFRLARTMNLLGAVAAEVTPIDTVYVDFRNEAGLAAECRAAVRDGYTAKMAIHPAQVPVINAAFTPSEAALAEARAIVAAFAAAGDAGVIGIDGKMFDRPHLKRAERLIARAGG
ncbi:CoA ester lyase [Prosthecomicrobium hirschii]|uniref:HpcH/HpaI aldolase/citrate lyase family protein n=1 Tax=Prosthecodimorpha hirschii TaxID=665126 RepID=UPI001127A874|nr:CoA ester lyase [Prosthecomicrobium hirschii]TPQ49493.1 CoA ester lyase [Prosthecomicrobium hirschii]